MQGESPEPNITNQQKEELCLICHRNNLDEKTRRQALKLIIEHKIKVAPRNQIENFSLLARVSIMVAAKSQEVKTMNGDICRGIGLNLSALLKDCNFELDMFLFYLKEFAYNVSIHQDVNEEIKRLVDKFSYCMKFYEKFSSMFDKLDFKYLDSKSQTRELYLKYQKQFGWLLFICARNEQNLKPTDVYENVCLISSVFNAIVMYAPGNYLASCYLTNKYPNLKECPTEFEEIIAEDFLDYLCVRNKDDYLKVKTNFDQYMVYTV